MSSKRAQSRFIRTSHRTRRVPRVEALNERRLMAADIFEAVDSVGGTEFDLLSTGEGQCKSMRGSIDQLQNKQPIAKCWGRAADAANSPA